MTDINKELKHLERTITYLRQRKSLTQVELGELLGVSKQSISKYENGTTKLSVDKLLWYMHYFKIPLTDFFGLGYKPLSKEEADIIEWFRSCPSEMRRIILYIIKYHF